VADDVKRCIEIHIPSELGYEKVAMEAAGAAAKRMGYSPDRIQDLKTAVAEACLNAIEHGNKLDVSTKVGIVLTIQPAKLEVDITDEGRQPFPDQPTQSGRLTDNRGWGMFLIQNLVDEVEVSTESDGSNQVHMVIHLDKC